MLEGCDEYLILNEMAEDIFNGEVIVWGAGIPVRYYPWENSLETVAYEMTESGACKMKISMNPLELCVIVLVRTAAALEELEITAPIAKAADFSMSVDTFTVGRVTAVDYLAQLSQAGEGVRTKNAVVKAGATEIVKAPFTGMQEKYPDFSGYYIYETKVALNQGTTYRLAIEDVCETVEVFLNGVSLGNRYSHYRQRRHLHSGSCH